LQWFIPRAARLSRIKAVIAPQARAPRAPANKQAGRKEQKGKIKKKDKQKKT
jgi:hypothetical protein